MKKRKKFLVTGGTGFIGSNICRLLIKKGHKVLVFDNNQRGTFEKVKDLKNRIRFINADIRNRDKVFNAIKKSDAVIHLAYVNGTKFSVGLKTLT